MFEDGDHFVIILRRDLDRGWVLSDEGHTLMHLSYSGVDLDRGTRAKVIDHTLSAHGVTNQQGELRLHVPDNSFGDALFTFVQAIAAVSATTLWTRERVDNAFRDDARNLLHEVVGEPRLIEEFVDRDIDPDGTYPADYLVRGVHDHLVFVVATEHQCNQATITSHFYESKKRRVRSVVLFEDQTQISRRSVAQLSNVVGKQFAHLDRDRIKRYFREDVLAETNGHA